MNNNCPGRDMFKNETRWLVVDDNEDLQMMLADRLRAWGYDVAIAGNGQEALKYLQEISVIGFFLDIEMPVMNGLTLLSELKRRDMQVPVIVMSAGSDPQQFDRAMALGAVDYLRKPIDSELLAQKCVRVF